MAARRANPAPPAQNVIETLSPEERAIFEDNQQPNKVHVLSLLRTVLEGDESAKIGACETIWDHAVDPGTAAFIADNGGIDILFRVIELHTRSRLLEVAMGTIGNVAAAVPHAVASHASFVPSVFGLFHTVTDAPTLTEVVRTLSVVLHHAEVNEVAGFVDGLLRELDEPEFIERLTQLLQNALFEPLLMASVHLVAQLLYVDGWRGMREDKFVFVGALRAAAVVLGDDKRGEADGVVRDIEEEEEGVSTMDMSY